LSLREFDVFNVARARVALHTERAARWLADDTRTALGVIAYHHLYLDCSLVVCRRNGDGTLRASDRADRWGVRDDAQRGLLDKIETAAIGDVMQGQTRAH
jgi:hypothetical protein